MIKNNIEENYINDIKTNQSKVNTDLELPKIWIKCSNCKKIMYYMTVDNNDKVCPYCNNHLRLTAEERIDMVLDNGSFEEFCEDIPNINYLDFEGYSQKIDRLQNKLNTSEAVITGRGSINNKKIIICIMQSQFMMGSMGAVVGERIMRAIEYAIEEKLPLIIFTASGGARMQEGMVSLMQMAKISGGLSRLSKSGQLYITVITDPTTGGVTASFAMQGDIILSEPNALIGFAGKRVIKQTLRKDLPEGFQTAEFVLEHGFIDRIVHRKELKDILSKILTMHGR